MLVFIFFYIGIIVLDFEKVVEFYIKVFGFY